MFTDESIFLRDYLFPKMSVTDSKEYKSLYKFFKNLDLVKDDSQKNDDHYLIVTEAEFRREKRAAHQKEGQEVGERDDKIHKQDISIEENGVVMFEGNVRYVMIKNENSRYKKHGPCIPSGH